MPRQVGKYAGHWKGHDESVHSICFGPYGMFVLSATVNEVCVWDFPSLEKLIEETTKRFKSRPLTPEERRMYYLD